MDPLRSTELLEALRRAVQSSEPALLFDRLERMSGVPGPHPNIELARAMGGAIAAYGRRADALVGGLLASANEYFVVVGVMSLAARHLAGLEPDAAIRALHDLADDPRRLVREGVAHAIRALVTVRGADVVAALASWTDGYLHAHVALDALTERGVLAQLPFEAGVVDRLDEAFALADASPRSHERSHGLRALRRGLPDQIARTVARYPEALPWIEAQTRKKRPETREVVAATVTAVRKTLSGAEADRLAKALAATAPAPRDPSRIVHGTRKRSRGRKLARRS